VLDALVLLLIPLAVSVPSLSLRVLRAGQPASGITVRLGALERETDASGVVRFRDLEPGAHVVAAGSLQWTIVLSSEAEVRTIDLEAPSIDAGRFGRSDLTRERLARLPHAGTVSTVLETLDPYAITDRIDVAGVESATQPLWSVRGSSFTQNRVLLDGIDVTDPAGGASLFYPDVAFFEEISLATSANPPEAGGPGAELHLVTRAPPRSIGGTFAFRYSGSAFQSENLNEELVGFGVEPREMHRFTGARIELGASRFYGAVNGFDLAAGMPHFDAEETTSLLGVTGKWTGTRASLLGIAQRIERPTFGAHPGFAPEAAFDAKERFQIAQASIRASPILFRLGFARGRLEPSFTGGGSPLRDLATEEVNDAPLLVTDRTRSRWSASALGDFTIGGHLLRGELEFSRAAESGTDMVPGGQERLTVGGAPHAVSFFSGEGQIDAVSTRVGLQVQDAFFLDFLGRSFRLQPGARLEWSGAGRIRWWSASGSLAGGVLLSPSSELHFSAGLYPHLATTRIPSAAQRPTFVRHRWTDADGDLQIAPGEVGAVMSRGGGGFTDIEDDLPRPRTIEFTIGIEKRYRRGLLRFSGYRRWDRRLLQTVNVGIADESYARFFFHDVGVDGDLDTSDDREIPVYDQTSQFGSDLFLLTHPQDLSSVAQGVDLLLGFDHGRISWRLSGRAYMDTGSGDVGNEAPENDTGTLGDLFDDPNTVTSAEGRLFFDRAFTGKLALTADAPFELDLGLSIRYWDGQPFARHLFFPDLGQGFTIVQAFPRGLLRYSFNMTVDVRLEREVRLGPAGLNLAFEVFNLFNQTLQTGEDVTSGPQFRTPTFVQPARTVVLEGRIRF
jgi:hypothetical protein